MNITLKNKRGAAALCTLSLVIVLNGCASFSSDGGFDEVKQTTQARIGQQAQWNQSEAEQVEAARRVAELLNKPLSMDAAVQVALLNNRALQAAYFELRLAEADVVQSGRLPNPRLTFGRLNQGGAREWDRSWFVDLARLVTMPLANGVNARRFEQARQQATLDTLSLAQATRKAWINAVASSETARYMQQVWLTAEASEELAERLVKAGNWSRLDLAREQGFYAEAGLNVARAVQAQTAARERLTRLLGLWGSQTSFTLPERLPDLPVQPEERPGIEQQAISQRIDLQAMKAQMQALAKNLGLSKVTRVVNVFEVGAVHNTFSDAPLQSGYEISLEIPLFDWGGTRVAKSEALYMQAANQLAQAAIEARSEVRESYQSYRIGYDIARHYRDEVAPLSQRISEENQLRYNGMLIGVFDLLADARAQIAAANGYIESLRDFWLADSDLQMALIGQPAPTPMHRTAVFADPGAAN